MSAQIREPGWISRNVVIPVVQGQTTDADYNRDLNILFVKLHLLDPTAVMPAFHHLSKGIQKPYSIYNIRLTASHMFRLTCI